MHDGAVSDDGVNVEPSYGADCNRDGRVTIDELVATIDIALGRLPVSRCDDADLNDDQQITIDEVVGAIGQALDGAQVDAVVAAAGVAADTPGAAVMVISDGRILHSAGYGLADVAHGTPITSHSVFHLASATKDFTAMAIMMLAEQGELDYDDPISKYIPELARFGDGVTIRRVLHHTSGLADYSNDFPLYVQIQQQYPMPSNADELTMLAGSGKLLFTPGDQFHYTNTGYEMLAVVIERVSGESYGDFLQEHVFGPLGMASSFSRPNPARLADADRALGYAVTPNTVVLSDANPFDDLAGAASVYSSTEDLYRYDQAEYTDQLVQQSTLAEAFMPGQLNDGSEVLFDLSPDPNDSYGFGRVLGTHNGERYVASAGDWPGFRSYIARFVDRQLTVIILLNREDVAFDTLALDIADVYLPTLVDDSAQ